MSFVLYKVKYGDNIEINYVCCDTYMVKPKYFLFSPKKQPIGIKITVKY